MDVPLRLFAFLMKLNLWNGPPYLSQDLTSGLLSSGWFFLESRFPEICSVFSFGPGFSPLVLFLRLPFLRS